MLLIKLWNIGYVSSNVNVAAKTRTSNLMKNGYQQTTSDIWYAGFTPDISVWWI